MNKVRERSGSNQRWQIKIKKFTVQDKNKIKQLKSMKFLKAISESTLKFSTNLISDLREYDHSKPASFIKLENDDNGPLYEPANF